MLVWDLLGGVVQRHAAQHWVQEECCGLLVQGMHGREVYSEELLLLHGWMEESTALSRSCCPLA